MLEEMLEEVSVGAWREGCHERKESPTLPSISSNKGTRPLAPGAATATPPCTPPPAEAAWVLAGCLGVVLVDCAEARARGEWRAGERVGDRLAGAAAARFIDNDEEVDEEDK